MATVGFWILAVLFSTINSVSIRITFILFLVFSCWGNHGLKLLISDINTNPLVLTKRPTNPVSNMGTRHTQTTNNKPHNNPVLGAVGACWFFVVPPWLERRQSSGKSLSWRSKYFTVRVQRVQTVISVWLGNCPTNQRVPREGMWVNRTHNGWD